MSISVADLVATLRADTSQFKSGMSSATADLLKVGSSSVAVGNIVSNVLQKMAEAVVDLALSFYTTALAAGQYAEELQRVQTVTGLSTDSIQNLNVALNRSGGGISDISTMFRRLSGNIEDAKDGVSEALIKFEAIGVTIRKSDDGESVLRKISDAYLRMGEGTERARSSMDLLGRSGQTALPFLSQGARHFDEMAEKAAKMGKMTAAQVDEMGKMDDAFDDLRMASKMFMDQFGVTFGPMLKVLAEAGTTAISFLTQEMMKARLEVAELGNQVTKVVNLFSELPRAIAELFSGIATGTLDEAWAAHKKREQAILDEADAISVLITKEKDAVGTSALYASTEEKKAETIKNNLKLREAMKPVKLLAVDEELKSVNAFWANYVAQNKAALGVVSATSEQYLAEGIISQQQFVSEKNSLQRDEHMATELSLQRQLEAHREFMGKKRALLAQDRSVQGQVALATFDLQSPQEEVGIRDRAALARQQTQMDFIRGKTAETEAARDAAKIQLETSASMAASDLQIAQANHADNSALRALRLQEIEIGAQRELAIVGLTQDQITAIHHKADADRATAATQFPNAFDQAMQDIINSSSFSMGQLVNQFSGAMADWMMGISNFQNFFKNAMRSLAQSFINEALKNMASAAMASGMGKLFGLGISALGAFLGGGVDASGGTAGAVGSGVLAQGGGLTGAGATFSLPTSFTPPSGVLANGYADGGSGDFGSGTPVMLHGKEKITPLSDRETMGGSPVNIAITVNAGKGGGTESGGGAAPNFDQLARSLSQLVERKIIDEQRPGGLLSGMA